MPRTQASQLLRALALAACACLVLARTAPLAAADFPQLLTQARAARQAHDPAKAIELYSAAIEANPWSGEAWLERGYVYWGREQRTLARLDFNQAVLADPTFAQAYVTRGDLDARMSRRDWKGCEHDYATALKLQPDFPFYFAYTAELYLYNGQPARAIAEARKGLAKDPTALIYKMNLAHGLLFTGQVEAARKLYTEMAPLEVEPGMNGVAFALHDFDGLRRIGEVVYPQIAETEPWLKGLATR